jgi:hypothetical protein
MSESNKRSIDSWIWGLVIFLGLILILGGGYSLWSRYNPWFDESPEFADARTIQSAVRNRPLTEAEFAVCMQLCESGEMSARLSAIASLEAAVRRTPEYKPEASKVLKRVAAGKDTKASAAATAVLGRLTSPAAK